MKKTIANYSLILLASVVLFGLFQAKKQNRCPFADNSSNEKSIAKSALESNVSCEKIRFQDDSFNVQSTY